MKNQPPQPLTGRRRPTTPPAEQPATTPAGAEVTPAIAGINPTTSPPTSTSSPARTSSTSSPATANTPPPPPPKERPRMAVMFFSGDQYDVIQGAAEFQGQEVCDWISDTLTEVANSLMAYAERDQDGDTEPPPPMEEDDGDEV